MVLPLFNNSDSTPPSIEDPRSAAIEPVAKKHKPNCFDEDDGVDKEVDQEDDKTKGGTDSGMKPAVAAKDSPSELSGAVSASEPPR